MNRFLPEVCPTQTQMPLDFGGDPERDPGQTISFMIACCPICGGNYYIYIYVDSWTLVLLLAQSSFQFYSAFVDLHFIYQENGITFTAPKAAMDAERSN